MTKTQLFKDMDIEEVASRFKILSETSRLKIIRVLHNRESCVNEIIDETGLQQANVSKQLKILQNAGVVECRPDGLQRYYQIIDKTVINICKQVCKSHKQENSEGIEL
jgi:DNA-binding transcriptional ArsR family regulator